MFGQQVIANWISVTKRREVWKRQHKEVGCEAALGDGQHKNIQDDGYFLGGLARLPFGGARPALLRTANAP